MPPGRSSHTSLHGIRVRYRVVGKGSKLGGPVSEPKGGKQMARRIRPPSPAMIVAVIALFVAIGGVGYAASKIDTEDIKSQAVTKPKIAKKAVTTGKLGARAVETGEIGGEAVRSGKIRDGAVKTDDLQDQGVTTDKLADSAVNGGKVQDDSLTGSEIEESTLGT